MPSTFYPRNQQTSTLCLETSIERRFLKVVGSWTSRGPWTMMEDGGDLGPARLAGT